MQSTADALFINWEQFMVFKTSGFISVYYESNEPIQRLLSLHIINVNDASSIELIRNPHVYNQVKSFLSLNSNNLIPYFDILTNEGINDMADIKYTWFFVLMI